MICLLHFFTFIFHLSTSRTKIVAFVLGCIRWLPSVTGEQRNQNAQITYHGYLIRAVMTTSNYCQLRINSIVNRLIATVWYCDNLLMTLNRFQFNFQRLTIRHWLIRSFASVHSVRRSEDGKCDTGTTGRSVQVTMAEASLALLNLFNSILLFKLSSFLTTTRNKRRQ